MAKETICTRRARNHKEERQQKKQFLTKKTLTISMKKGCVTRWGIKTGSLTGKSHTCKKTTCAKNTSDLSSSLSFCSKGKNPALLLGLEYWINLLLTIGTLLWEKYNWEHQSSTLSHKWKSSWTSLQVLLSAVRYPSFPFQCFLECTCTDCCSWWCCLALQVLCSG